jgi:Flp pilus assembly protein TadG
MVKLHSFLRCVKGATIIEYAIVLPVLLWMIMGIVEYSLILYGSAVLEGSVTEAALDAQPNGQSNTGGYIESGLSEKDFITASVQNLSVGLLDSNKITINSNARDNNGAFVIPAFGAALTNFQPVIYTATYPWRVVTPFLQPILSTAITGPTPPGSSGIFIITASSVVLNPPNSPAVR